MLVMSIVLAAYAPSTELKELTQDKRIMKALRSFPGLKGCNKAAVLKRSNSDGELCRMALYATSAADGRQLRKSSDKYEAMTLMRAKHLTQALDHAAEAARIITTAKKPAAWRYAKATRAIVELCPIVEALKSEAAMAPTTAPKVRALSSNLRPGMSARAATCACINALDRVSRPIRSQKKKYIQQARESITMAGCAAPRLRVSKHTRYVAPKRSRFTKDGQAKKLAAKKRISAPDRLKAINNVVERHRSEINGCAKEARKLGGTRAVRAKRMKRCICGDAKMWRFSPGPELVFEEQAQKGTLVLSLGINKIGKVKTCGVVVKK